MTNDAPPLVPRPAVDLPTYETRGNHIYVESFDTIRREADLSRFRPDFAQVAVRMIHAAGDISLAADIDGSGALQGGAGEVAPGPGAISVVAAARSALRRGAPIFTDAHMVRVGITRSRLPLNNDVICTLRDPQVPELAARRSTTRSAAAVELWLPRLEGSVVAIGNAPTALFELLSLLADGHPAPAAIIGCPVGFIGAAESKDALAEAATAWGIPWLTVRQRRGGSAITCAAINALASEKEIIW